MSNSGGSDFNNKSRESSFPVPRSRTEGGQHNFLPASAPVSSLLPSIPHQAQSSGMNGGSNPLANPAIQAQLAALISQGGLSGNSGLNPSATSTMNSLQPMAQSQLLAARFSGGSHSNSMLSTANMHSWSLEQLESHVNMLKQLGQHVPHNVNMLLSEARKRAEKRHAKRIANRKSASTSRARKKALVKEMTELNTRLRRQALILSLLPDLVIVIDLEGKITFCSAQVERVLRHGIDDLIGAKLTDIMVPESRPKLVKLIRQVLGADRGADHVRPSKNGEAESKQKKKKSKKMKKDQNEVSDKASGSTSANAVTDTSFPLSVVQVAAPAGVAGSSDENENSDTSASNSKQPSSLTNSSLGNSGSDDCTPKKDDRAATTKKSAKTKKEQPSSDSSNTSSTESSDAKNLLSANANLERNVRWHNKKIKDKAVAAQLRAGYKDDVIGAAVTANNASARLSSLQHLPGSTSSEEDSGYRESNDSREETSSSEGDNISEGNGRRKPIAPTCNVCLIRNDLSTIWCEVTSSVRSQETEENSDSSASKPAKKQTSVSPSASAMKKHSSKFSKEADNDGTGSGSGSGSQKNGKGGKAENHEKTVALREILLCLRPIRDGDAKTGEENRFKPPTKDGNRVISLSTTGNGSSGEETSSSRPADGLSGDTIQVSDNVTQTDKKRCNSSNSGESESKRQRLKDNEGVDSAVVASLMSMSAQK